MKNHLGIDHPLVAVRDMDKVIEEYAKLGFFINPRHHHPWGTDNHLLMFPDNFIELISVYDERKLDLKNEKGFAFGRFIDDSIRRREGISLVALHSEDARADHQMLEQRGVENQGIVDFRRVAHRPDGSEEEAVVSLVMLINSECPAISNFFCHQHKPELVWVEEWMNHPNGANAITAVSYIAPEPAQFIDRFSGIYGAQAVNYSEGYLQVQTDRGIFEVMSPAYADHRFAGVELSVNQDELPSGVAIRVSTATPKRAREILLQNAIDFVDTTDGGLRIAPHCAGNTIIEIYPSTEA
ncbi:MAG: VOC family protein [Pseudomonadales bacterium]